MLKIGITGGIGSGKSTVCSIFKTLGIPIYDADIEAKKLYDSDVNLKQEIIKHFGEEVYPNNIFDSIRMRALVFNDPTKLRLLNSIVHPKVIEHARHWIQLQHSPYILKEAALLIESGAYHEVDKIILVSCPKELRIKRVFSRDGLSPNEVLQRINNQLSDEEKRTLSNFEIVNDETQLLIPQVLQIHEELMKQSQSIEKHLNVD